MSSFINSNICQIIDRQIYAHDNLLLVSGMFSPVFVTCITGDYIKWQFMKFTIMDGCVRNKCSDFLKIEHISCKFDVKYAWGKILKSALSKKRALLMHLFYSHSCTIYWKIPSMCSVCVLHYSQIVHFYVALFFLHSSLFHIMLLMKE